MMHMLKQWIKFDLSSNSQNWLEHRVSNKNPKNYKTTWMFLKKLTNWSSHKLENSLEWSITSIQQANFINFNLIEQNPQIGFNTSLRIFNFSQSPKLIKLTNIYHEYNNIGAKPNDQFQKKKMIQQKSQTWKVPKIPLKCMSLCMKSWK